MTEKNKINLVDYYYNINYGMYQQTNFIEN